MKTQDQWSRRRFSKAIVSAQIFMASGAFSIPVSCDKAKNSEMIAGLDVSDQETLKYAMDEIIPASESMPSASEVKGIHYILNILEELPELKPLFVALIHEIDLLSDHNFPSSAKEERVKVLTSLEQNKPELFGVLKDFTYESYYTNEKVYNLIGYEPYPTGSSGPKMEAFDENLLNKVKGMPPRYTKI